MSALNDFPNPRKALIEDGVIAVGGNLDAANLKLSYSLGIFPWPHEGYPLLWFCPDQRGILEFKDLHISKSLNKWIKKNELSINVTVNQNFRHVIENCSLQKRAGQIDKKGRPQTWITKDMIRAYCDLAVKQGALSVECWQEGEMISGVYGVLSKNYFSCESMFFKKPNASKFAFIQLVKHLQKKYGFTWMDLQMVTDVSGAFGAKYITRDQFLNLI